MAIKRPPPAHSGSRDSGTRIGSVKRRLPDRPELEQVDPDEAMEVLLRALTAGPGVDCAPAYSPTTNLLALALPPSSSITSPPLLVPLLDVQNGRLAESTSTTRDNAPRLFVSLSHLASPPEATVPRISVRLAIPLPSTGSGATLGIAGETWRITLLSWRPDGEQLLCVSSPASAKERSQGDLLTLFEHRSACLDEGWEIVLQEQVGRFGTPLTEDEGTRGKRVVSLRWLGEPRRWYPTPTFPDSRESSKKPLYCAPPRSAPLSETAFVAVLSSDEILFISPSCSAPPTLTSTTALPLAQILCLPLHPSPSSLTSSSPSPPGLTLTAVPTPLTPLPYTLTSSNLPPSLFPSLDPVPVTSLGGPSPQTTVDALVSSLVSTETLNLNLSLPVPPLSETEPDSTATGTGTQALRDELKLSSCAASSTRRREVRKAAIGAARSRGGGAENGETVFVVASWSGSGPGSGKGVVRKGRTRKEKNDEKDANPLSGAAQEGGVKNEPFEGLATSQGLDGIGGGMDYSFDADPLLSTDFTSLDEAFGASTSASTSTVTVPTFEVKKDEEGGTEKDKAGEDEEVDLVWAEVDEEGSRGKWKVELTEVRVEMTASEGPRLTLRPQPPLYLSPSPALSASPSSSPSPSHTEISDDPLLTHLLFLGDVALPHPLSSLTSPSPSTHLTHSASESAVDLCLLAVTAAASPSPSQPQKREWQSTLTSYALSHASTGYVLSEAFHGLEGRRLDAKTEVEGEKVWAGRLDRQKSCFTTKGEADGDEVGGEGVRGVVTAVTGWVGGGEWGSFAVAVAQRQKTEGGTEAGESSGRKWRTSVRGMSSVTLEPLDELTANEAVANRVLVNGDIHDDEMESSTQEGEKKEQDAAFFLPGSHLYQSFAISPNGGHLCALPCSRPPSPFLESSDSHRAPSFQPVIAPSPNKRSTEPLPTRLAVRLALCLARQASPSDLTARISALGPEDARAVLVETGELLQSMLGEEVKLEGSALGWELLGVAAGIYGSLPSLHPLSHLAHLLLSLAALVHSFAQTCVPLRPPAVPGSTEKPKPLPRWEDDAVWPLVGACGWVCGEVLSSLPEGCQASGGEEKPETAGLRAETSITTEEKEKRPESNCAFLFTHPVALDILFRTLSQILAFRDYLQFAATSSSEMGQGGSEVVELAKDVVGNLVDEAEVERWMEMVRKLKEDGAAQAVPHLSSFLTLSLPPSHQDRTDAFLTLLQQTFPVAASSAESTLPTPPRSPHAQRGHPPQFEAGWDAIRRARLPLSSSSSSASSAASPGSGRQCLRCGRRTFAPVEGQLEAAIAVGVGMAGGERWRMFEAGWEGGCVSMDALIDAREEEDFQRAIALSLAEQQGGGLASTPQHTTSSATSSCKRPRANREPSPASERTASSPTLSSSCGNDLYLELLQYQTQVMQRGYRSDASASTISYERLETWQVAALDLAQSPQMQAIAPQLMHRLQEVALGADAEIYKQEGKVPEVQPWPEGLARYRNGALHITRTPGRAAINTPNCIELGEVLRKESMLGGFIGGFILEHDFLVPFLPVEGSGPHSRRDVPLYISRDLDADPLRNLACLQAGVSIPVPSINKLTQKNGEKVADPLCELYRHMLGPNWNASYPWTSGCAHSKFFLIRYEGFLLIGITSCNFMRIDTELSDNHWFIMSFPEFPTPARLDQVTPFEQMLLSHCFSRDCPQVFLDLISRRYDFSAARDRIHLVVSEPKVKHGAVADSYGALRLNALARQLIDKKYIKKDRLELEICTGSVGVLNETWVRKMDWLLKGKRVDKLMDIIEEGEVDELEMPEWRVEFPTKQNVWSCDYAVREAASNIGCSIRNDKWPTTPFSIKSLFHDYTSKDPGRLFHQKLILWLDKHDYLPPSAASTPSAADSPEAPDPYPPFMLYLGSHNLSQNAWGDVAPNRSDGEPKLLSSGNLELGIVVTGEVAEDMLEPGSRWEDLITYERPVKQYGEGDMPSNSPAWIREEK
ncbi:hypothetical protein JCM11641_005174 [Rhodosporidiobolus odoratus]